MILPWTIRNSNANDQNLHFVCHIPTNLGSYKLYVKDLKIHLQDADPDDYVNTVTIYGVSQSGVTSLNTDGTNRDGPGSYTYTFTAKDASSYVCVLIRVSVVWTGGGQFDLIPAVELEVYYG